MYRESRAELKPFVYFLDSVNNRFNIARGLQHILRGLMTITQETFIQIILFSPYQSRASMPKATPFFRHDPGLE